MRVLNKTLPLTGHYRTDPVPGLTRGFGEGAARGAERGEDWV